MELALVTPVLLIMLLIGIDFSRIFLGWINLQSMAKNAANFAANNPQAWVPPFDIPTQQRYQALVQQDAAQINCELPGTVPDPQFSGTVLGANVKVEITCLFGVLTPGISSVVGNQVVLGAFANFPVKSGGVTGVYGGGSPPVPAPAPSIVASPTGGSAPLTVDFSDASSNSPTSWIWQFGDGFGSTEQNPTHVFSTANTYTVQLHVCNSGGCADATTSIMVAPAPTSGPLPAFTATPRSGPYPLTVQFTDQSTGTVATRSWSFGDGGTSAQQNPTYAYQNPGTYTVELTVTDGTTSNTETRVGYVVVANSPCVIPNFTGVLKNAAQSVWDAAGFQTTVQKQNGGGNYSIQYQSLAALLTNPPNGCFATITVGP